jgi:hypothetical protein
MTRFSKIFASAAFAAVLLPLATSAAPLNQPQMIASNNAIPMKFTTQETAPQDPNLMDLPYTVAKLQNQVVVQQAEIRNLQTVTDQDSNSPNVIFSAAAAPNAGGFPIPSGN